MFIILNLFRTKFRLNFCTQFSLILSISNELSLIRDSLELYKTKIMPLLQFTRFIKYPVIFIDKQSNTSGFSKKLMPTFHFKPQKVNKQKELFPSKYNVISNKK